MGPFLLVSAILVFVDSAIIPTINIDVPVTTPDKRCRYELSDTTTCNVSRVFARGYCEKHYRSLKRAGAFDTDTKALTPAYTKARNIAVVRRAARKLHKLAPDFVDDLAVASKTASKKGDASPAQWALLHTRVIEPVSEKTISGMSTGTTINIGVKVSGAGEK